MKRGHSILVIFAIVLASAFGLILARSIPNAVFPEVQFNRAVILADSGDLPPEQVLVGVTRPLEEAAYGVVGTVLVRSTTTRGSAEIDVTFAENADPTASYSLLLAALSDARTRLPADTEINTRLLTSSTYEILDVSMSSATRDLAALTDIAFYDLVPEFHRVSGVYRVDMSGDKYREYVVRLDPAQMRSHNLTPRQVVAGLAAANTIASAGRIMDSHRMLLTVVTADLHEVAQLAALPIANVGGQPIHVRDVGAVELAIREDYVRCESEHGPAIFIGVTGQRNSNTEAISRSVHQLIEQARVRYPDVNFTFNYDQAALVQESFDSVRDAIMLGLVLAVAVVYLFTLSALNALVAAIVVPCTILITFVVMKAAGLSFNMMTLGGLAAGIGLFIDDAIVMIEAIHRARSSGADTLGAVELAIRELRRPLIASTLTVIVVFAPLVFLSGVTGVFFRALATTLGAGLAISLVLALYFTPALEVLLKRLRRKSRGEGRLFGALRDGYLAVLRPFIRMPVLSLILVAGSIVIAVVLFRTIGTDYLPTMDEGAFVLDYITPPQSTLHDTGALLGKIEARLAATPEVVSFARRTGAQRGFQLSESNTGDITVRLRPERSRTIDQIMDSLRSAIESSVPGVHLEFSQVLQDLIGDLSGTPEPVEVKVFGADYSTIQATADQVAAVLQRTPGLVDVFNGIVLSNPEEEVLVDPAAAERYGLTTDDVSTTLQTVIEGTVATNLRVGDRLVGVRVRYPDAFHQDLSLLSEVMLKGGNGVPLSAITNLTWLGERPELARESLRSVVHVTARTEGIDLGTAMARVKERLRNFALPPGVTLEYGGLYADQQRAFSQLGMVLMAGTVVMFLILLWEFDRIAPAIAVLLGALACLCGSFILLDLTAVTLNISSFMGIIMVAGITAKNGILLLDHAEKRVIVGGGPVSALIAAAEIRLRPIMMTTLATAAGLLPLALGIGAGAKVQQPLALAVIGGLAFAMLFAIPIAGGIYLMGTRPPPPASAGNTNKPAAR